VHEPHDDLAAVLEEQRRYYAARAGDEYDEAYTRTGAHDHGDTRNDAWRSDMAALMAAFDRVPLHGDVVELAAGTGVWTERLVGRVDSLTVLDASVEMLEATRRRLGGSARHVDVEVVDLFDWRPPRRWDACVFAFWLAKVPDAHLDAFLTTVRTALHTGGTVCCVDKLTSVPVQRELETRALHDGREFTIVDHPRTVEQLADAFARSRMRVTVEAYGHDHSLTYGRAV
jgi:demethylmenaquinone methyltransferase/2-methoxy-6-polyprenyl-1,4-benzoquinol methylase